MVSFNDIIGFQRHSRESIESQLRVMILSMTLLIFINGTLDFINWTLDMVIDGIVDHLTEIHLDRYLGPDALYIVCLVHAISIPINMHLLFWLCIIRIHTYSYVLIHSRRLSSPAW